MIRKYFCLAITLWSLFMLPARASDIIDRIVATVNGHAILQSDWEEAIRYEAFIDGRQLDKLTADDRKATLDRLIDQELLREQVRSSASQLWRQASCVGRSQHENKRAAHAAENE